MELGQALANERFIQAGNEMAAFAVFIRNMNGYCPGMGLARILIDGYSLLHGWPDLAPGSPRHSAAARDELIHVLTQYQDTVGTPITVFFDGARAPSGTPKHNDTGTVEVLFSKAGKTADDLIERTAYRLLPYGGVLVVTNDRAERDVVLGFGGLASSCENFIRDVEARLGQLEKDVATYNRREKARFSQSR